MTGVRTIASIKAGQCFRVTRISGGRGLVKKLEDMGVRKGSVLKKLSQQPGTGPVIIRTGNTQLALGRGMAMKIEVEAV